MDSEIDGREVWVVTVGTEPSWRLIGVYSSERRAEAARTHLEPTAPEAAVTITKVRVDEDLAGN